jgi:hypothetical protein
MSQNINEIMEKRYLNIGTINSGYRSPSSSSMFGYPSQALISDENLNDYIKESSKKYEELFKTYKTHKRSIKYGKVKKSRLPLTLSLGIISAMMGVAFVGLPSPYNYMAILAMAGPLSASILGLRR